MSRTVVIAFNADEVLYLWAKTRGGEHGTDEKALPSVYPTLLKLASALCEVAKDAVKQPVEVALTLDEAECWLLREHVNVFEKTTDVAFGLKLTLKVAQALLTFEAPAMPDAEGGVDRTLTDAERAVLREKADHGGEPNHV